MSSSTFTPLNVVEMNKERDWAAKLGLMDWDSTRIVFTKRSLVEFLRYTGTTVDTNFTNVSKLPRYATFGKLSDASEGSTNEATPAETAPASEQVERTSSVSSGSFRPTRRVRTAPGGDTHDIFGHYVDDDALANAPRQDPEPEDKPEEQQAVQLGHNRNTSSLDEPQKPAFRPTRRVREMPGGRDSIADIL